MAYIGPNSLAVILQRVVIPTPIIAKVLAYPEKTKGTARMAIHVMSDGGAKDTVIKKLCLRAREDLQKVYEGECPYGLERFRFIHTDTKAKVPDKLQVLYVRPDIT